MVLLCELSLSLLSYLLLDAHDLLEDVNVTLECARNLLVLLKPVGQKDLDATKCLKLSFIVLSLTLLGACDYLL